MNYIELCKKLKALAERGEGGEKSNAMQKLRSIMEKHNISESDIDEDEKHDCSFRVTKEQYKLFVQIVYSVVGQHYKVYPSMVKGYYVLTITRDHELQIRFLLEVYWKDYKKQLNLFYTAFVMKNKIYPENDDREPKELTDERRSEIFLAMQMANGIKKTEILKQINQ